MYDAGDVKVTSGKGKEADSLGKMLKMVVSRKIAGAIFIFLVMDLLFFLGRGRLGFFLGGRESVLLLSML